MPTPGYVFRNSGTTPPANEESLQEYLGRNGESSAAVQHEGYATGVERHVADHSNSQKASGISSGSTTKAIGNTEGGNSANRNLVNRHSTDRSSLNQKATSPTSQTLPGVTINGSTNGTTGDGKIAELKAKAFEYKEHAVNELNPDGHEIARKAPPVAGAVQDHQNRSNESDVRDLGWHLQSHELPDPLIGELSNGELFSRIRRFNKV